MADPVVLITRFEQAQARAQEVLDKLLAQAEVQATEIASLRADVAQLGKAVETLKKGGK